ncbi:MAG: HypC/HybG/HupF family hydrogenase formation chaperone [Desulfobacterales bacterium]
MLLEDATVGDYVIVHAGFAIQKLEEREAAKNLWNCCARQWRRWMPSKKTVTNQNRRDSSESCQ